MSSNRVSMELTAYIAVMVNNTNNRVTKLLVESVVIVFTYSE